ncbi:MAG: hypothetical protein PHV30_05180 [Candidatus Margulisbacteria bacterium]|nr:hypothetical protein [Candidatus Margulisiibacteriota bacterium]
MKYKIISFTGSPKPPIKYLEDLADKHPFLKPCVAYIMKNPLEIMRRNKDYHQFYPHKIMEKLIFLYNEIKLLHRDQNIDADERIQKELMIIGDLRNLFKQYNFYPYEHSFSETAPETWVAYCHINCAVLNLSVHIVTKNAFLNIKEARELLLEIAKVLMFDRQTKAHCVNHSLASALSIVYPLMDDNLKENFMARINKIMSINSLTEHESVIFLLYSIIKFYGYKTVSAKPDSLSEEEQGLCDSLKRKYELDKEAEGGSYLNPESCMGFLLNNITDFLRIAKKIFQ